MMAFLSGTNNVEAGLVHDGNEVYTEYPDPSRDEWQTKILPALKKMSLSELVKQSGLSERALQYLRAEKSRPHAKHLRVLKAIAETRLGLHS